MWTSLRVKNSKGDPVIAGSHTFVSPPEAQLGFHSEYWGKNPLIFWEGEGGSKHFEICQKILFLTRSALRRN